MTKKELSQKLQSSNIDQGMYCLDGGFPNEALTLKQDGYIWQVYYSEKGLKTGLKAFDSESEACHSMLHMILKGV